MEENEIKCEVANETDKSDEQLANYSIKIGFTRYKNKYEAKKNYKFNRMLIAAVYPRSFMYRGGENQKNQRKQISSAWKEIAAELGQSGDVCRMRWRNLKDTFNRLYSKWITSSTVEEGIISKKPIWPLFDSLMFLKDGANSPGGEESFGELEGNNKNGKRNEKRRKKGAEQKGDISRNELSRSALNERLIAAIYSRSFLYNKEDLNHDRKELVAVAWKEIAEEVGYNERFCRTRWRSLKDTFVRLYSRWMNNSNGEENEGRPTWPWFNSLMFLKDSSHTPKPEDFVAPMLLPSDVELSSGEEDPNEPNIKIIPVRKSAKIEAKKRRQDPKSDFETVPKSSLDKFMRLLEKPKVEPPTRISAFCQYLNTELENFNEQQQDTFMEECMDILLKMKRSKRESVQ